MKECASDSADPSLNPASSISGGISQQGIDPRSLALGEAGFKESFYDDYAHLESTHFWFRARSRIIVWALHKYIPNLSSFFDIGCGTGYVLEQIANAFPTARLGGSEIFASGLRFAASRLPLAELVQMDASQLRLIEEFDAIGVFDVLEHIQDDVGVLAKVHLALKKDGIVLLTVPQHKWLWSPVDAYSGHVRRYSTNELQVKVEQAGFSILYTTSFVSTLLPAMLVSRMLQRAYAPSRDATAELRVHPILSTLFYILMMGELAFMRLGGVLPFGGSRLIVAKRI